MVNFFTNNIGAKLLAFLVAFGVWAYVASGESRVINLPSSIPIKARSVSDGLIAKLNNNEIEVKVAAERSKFQKLSADSFDAYVDLTSKTKGTYTDVPVIVTSKDPAVEIREINPSFITVTLDPAITKTIPVAVKISGKPGEGLAPDDPIVEPEKVEVRGAKSDVDRILEATAEIKLKDDTQEVKKTVNLVGYNARGEEVRDLVFNPSEVIVTVPIVKAGKAKTVGIKAKTSGQVKSGLWVSQISVTPNIVGISGNSEVLSSTVFIETESINIDNLSEDKTYKVALEIPTGIILLDSIEEVTVAVKLSSADSTKEIIASFGSIGLSSELTMNTFQTEPIKVLVSGPSKLLETLNSSSITVNLDLGIFGDSGLKRLDIPKAWIKVPEGISIIRYNPSSITVELKSKN